MIEDDFPDGHHLIEVGTVTFSRRLGAEHVRPWLTTLRRWVVASCVARS
jgi:hypothetical protein